MIIAIYAALLVFVFIYLSFRVIGFRRKHLVALGDDGHKDLNRAIRAQGNFAEYVPFALILIFLFENGGAPGWSIHAFGGSLLLGRLVHAYGVSQVKENIKFRQVGMVLTFLVMLFAAIGLLLQQL